MDDFRFTSAGWIARVAQDFTFKNIRMVTQGIANYIKQNGQAHRGVIVAFDNRYMSGEFADECTKVLLGNGIHVTRATRSLPAPGVSYAVYKLHLAGGLMITANYSKSSYNGIKFIPDYAGPLTEEIIQSITSQIERVFEKKKVYEMEIEEAREFDLVKEVHIEKDFMQYLRRLIIPSLFKQGKGHPLRVVIDPMWGSAIGYVETMLEELGCDVKLINAKRDPLFGGIRPIPRDENLKDLKRAVISYHADIGLALDADGGTFGVVDEKGEFMTVNHALAMILSHLLETRALRGPVCRTVATTHMLDSIVRNNVLPLEVVPVGFRYVAETMRRNSCMLGGEENGGLSVMGHVSDKDGILACMLLAEARITANKPLSQILEDMFEKYGEYHDKRIDLPLHPDKRKFIIDKLQNWMPAQFAGYAVVTNENLENDNGKYFELDNGTWIVVRTANTVDKIRYYVESRTREDLEEITTYINEKSENFFMVSSR